MGKYVFYINVGLIKIVAIQNSNPPPFVLANVGSTVFVLYKPKLQLKIV